MLNGVPKLLLKIPKKEKCLKNSQTFMAAAKIKSVNFFKKLRLYKQVFNIMQPDEISLAAKSDSLIVLYGEHLLSRHKRAQIATVVSNPMIEMARLKIAIKTHFMENLKCMFDVLKPEYFENLVNGTRIISGYDEETMSYPACTLALHMGGNVKTLCNVAYSITVEKESHIPLITWSSRNMRIKEIEELKQLLKVKWNSKVSSLALKI